MEEVGTTHNSLKHTNRVNVFKITSPLATKVRYAHSCFWTLLFLPYPPGNSKLQLLPIPTREEKCHISLNYETVMTIPDLPVAISDTSRGTLPYKFPAISSDLKAIAIIPSLSLITHETEECHINRGHAKLESFKVKAEVLTKTMEDLTKKKKRTSHPIRYRTANKERAESLSEY
jgi:hypothetical protein